MIEILILLAFLGPDNGSPNLYLKGETIIWSDGIPVPCCPKQVSKHLMIIYPEGKILIRRFGKRLEIDFEHIDKFLICYDHNGHDIPYYTDIRDGKYKSVYVKQKLSNIELFINKKP